MPTLQLLTFPAVRILNQVLINDALRAVSLQVQLGGQAMVWHLTLPAVAHSELSLDIGLSTDHSTYYTSYWSFI